jgi:glycosyltransferase involved in cell wall biosynthesis
MSYACRLNNFFEEQRCCVLIPTYNNQKTLEKVITDTLEYTNHIVVVNDGSTDTTPQILEKFKGVISVVNFPENHGKGAALREGFKFALGKNYQYAISIDSDGQHYPEDLEAFLIKIKEQPNALIIGARNMEQASVPGKSSFGNKFSNFWFELETGIKMPDTQSGYRLYPIEKLKNISFYTSRFEFEIEVIVKAAWAGIAVVPLPVGVFYPTKEERVSHFRPTKDFFRISVLNTCLVPLAIIWYRPKLFIKNLTIANIKKYFKNAFFNKEESVLKKSLSVSLGIFFGIIPILGFQVISAIATAHLLKLNKAIVLVAINISLPPMIPPLVYASFKMGELITQTKSTFSFSHISSKNIETDAYLFIIGSCCLAVLLAIIAGLLTYISLTFIRNKKKNAQSSLQ